MRAADAIEKITRYKAEYLQKHKTKIINHCQVAENIELKWHLALLVSRLNLTKIKVGVILDLLTRWATNKKEIKIVRVNSIQSLFNILQTNQELLQDYNITI